MKKLLFLIGLALFVTTAAYSQNNTYSSSKDADPEATKILDKVKSKYQSLKSMEMAITITIDFPEQTAEVQKGQLWQQGDQYKFDLGTNTIYYNGTTIWMHLKELNEVQIMDGNMASAGVPSPKELMEIYEKGDFVYARTQRFAKQGRRIQQIEFKPLNNDYDYSKLRLSVDIDKHEILMVEAFGKGDGSKYILSVDKFTADKSYPANFFVFDEKDYPGVYVEDLR